MEQIKKIKVVWLCHFSNSIIRSVYPRKKNRPIYQFLRKILRLAKKNSTGGDFAPWITGAIEEIKKRSDIELYVISPQTDLKGLSYVFELDGIHYYFYNPNWTLLLMHLIKNNELWRRFQNSSTYVNKFIKRINPDIINLIGSENCYHSCAILDVKIKVPILITLQTFTTNRERLKYRPNVDKSKNWYIDELIHKKFKYFALGGKLYNDLLKQENPHAITFAHSFCGIPYPHVIEVEKEYDFVNVAMMHSSIKGSTDSVEALIIVKNFYPNVKLNIVGRLTPEFKQYLDDSIIKYSLQDNVIVTPFFEKQVDMFQHLQKSKFALLPIKLDIISGTVMQAMYYGLPVVTYKTSGTPYLNREKECVLIAEIDDVNQLAQNMLVLLQDQNKATMLRKNAMQFAQTYSDNTRKVDYLISDYYAILNNYYNGVVIPEKLLFNENKIGL